MPLPARFRAHTGALTRARTRALTTLLASLALAIALLLPSAHVAAGSAIAVTTTADTTVADGRCSLREAVLAANSQTSVDTCRGTRSNGTINLPRGRYVLSIAGRHEDAGRTGDLDFGGAITLRGASRGSTVIDANGIDRAIDILPGANVRLTGLTITGGYSDPSTGDAESGGGVLNDGTLTLQDSTVTANYAGDGGGGIASNGTLTVVGSTFDQNGAFEGAGGIAATGPVEVRDSRITNNTSGGEVGSKPHRDDPSVAAGIDSRQPLTLVRSLVSHNAGHGEWAVGGVTMRGGTIRDSTIGDNSGGPCGSGGVVMIWGTIRNSTISGNSAGECDGTGGVVAIDSQIWNSTISGNVAGSPYSPGGSMQVAGILSDVSTIIGTTITKNVNRAPVGNSTGPGGLLATRLSPPAFPGNLAAIRDTILADNRDANGAESDCQGTVTSDGHNLFGSVSGCDFQARSNDRIGVQPGLGPLADNGGPTRTHLPLPGSPAIDAWKVAGVGADGDCPRLDQRGAMRPLDGNGDGQLACDIGAVEVSRP
jgi:CSLREA domain-containing protein